MKSIKNYTAISENNIVCTRINTFYSILYDFFEDIAYIFLMGWKCHHCGDVTLPSTGQAWSACAAVWGLVLRLQGCRQGPAPGPGLQGLGKGAGTPRASLWPLISDKGGSGYGEAVRSQALFRCPRPLCQLHLPRQGVRRQGGGDESQPLTTTSPPPTPQLPPGPTFSPAAEAGSMAP